MKINQNNWFIPILIVALNALAIIVRWDSLPELLPAHYDLQGNAGGTMLLFMLAEPVIMLAAVSGFIVCIVKSCKKKL